MSTSTTMHQILAFIVFFLSFSHYALAICSERDLEKISLARSFSFPRNCFNSDKFYYCELICSRPNYKFKLDVIQNNIYVYCIDSEWYFFSALYTGDFPPIKSVENEVKTRLQCVYHDPGQNPETCPVINKELFLETVFDHIGLPVEVDRNFIFTCAKTLRKATYQCKERKFLCEDQKEITDINLYCNEVDYYKYCTKNDKRYADGDIIPITDTKEIVVSYKQCLGTELVDIAEPKIPEGTDTSMIETCMIDGKKIPKVNSMFYIKHCATKLVVGFVGDCYTDTHSVLKHTAFCETNQARCSLENLRSQFDKKSIMIALTKPGIGGQKYYIRCKDPTKKLYFDSSKNFFTSYVPKTCNDWYILSNYLETQLYCSDISENQKCRIDEERIALRKNYFAFDMTISDDDDSIMIVNEYKTIRCVVKSSFPTVLRLTVNGQEYYGPIPGVKCDSAKITKLLLKNNLFYSPNCWNTMNGCPLSCKPGYRLDSSEQTHPNSLLRLKCIGDGADKIFYLENTTTTTITIPTTTTTTTTTPPTSTTTTIPSNPTTTTPITTTTTITTTPTTTTTTTTIRSRYRIDYTKDLFECVFSYNTATLPARRPGCDAVKEGWKFYSDFRKMKCEKLNDVCVLV